VYLVLVVDKDLDPEILWWNTADDPMILSVAEGPQK